MKLGKIPYDIATPMLSQQWRFFPMGNPAPEEAFTTPPRVLGNAATISRNFSSRLRTNKRVVYDECLSRADEDSDNDLDSPPSLIQMTDDRVGVRKKAVSNSLYWI
jgi:hypothetical protein